MRERWMLEWQDGETGYRMDVKKRTGVSISSERSQAQPEGRRG